MNFQITTKEHHTAQAQAKKSTFSHLDVSDCALSSWAQGFKAGLHGDAIDALELGEDHGINGPAMATFALVDSKGTDTRADLVLNQYGRQLWRLPSSAAQRFGRVNIPAGANSRIQRKLGLSERQLIVPAKRLARVACAGAGCPGHLELERA
jgi:hypothetical protein